MAPPRTSLTDQQTHLNEYTQPHTTCNRVDWYNRPALVHGQPNHNPNFGGFPSHQFQQQQHNPICQPSCWDPPKYQSPQGYPPDDQHPSHQTSWWEPPGNCLGFAQYGQQHYHPVNYGKPPNALPTCWDPPLYGQRPYTNTESLNAPPTQYTTSTFGQSPYSSDALSQNPSVGYHSGLPEYQFTPSPYQPPSLPTCWDPPGLSAPQVYTAYDQPIPADCPLPCTTDSGGLLRPDLHHDPSSNSLPVAAVVPPPPAMLSSPCSHDINGEDEALLDDEEKMIIDFTTWKITFGVQLGIEEFNEETKRTK